MHTTNDDEPGVFCFFHFCGLVLFVVVYARMLGY